MFGQPPATSSLLSPPTVEKQVTAPMVAAKFKSKYEIYQFLAQEVKAYLCHWKCVNIFFLKALLSGEKKYIRCKDVEYVFVAQYDSLSVERMLRFADDYPGVFDYLPERKEIPKLPRKSVFFSELDVQANSS